MVFNRVESKLNHENCWMSYGFHGWASKKIANIFFLESGDGDYENKQHTVKVTKMNSS